MVERNRISVVRTMGAAIAHAAFSRQPRSRVASSRAPGEVSVPGPPDVGAGEIRESAPSWSQTLSGDGRDAGRGARIYRFAQSTMTGK
jgi:hypothetical protein